MSENEKYFLNSLRYASQLLISANVIAHYKKMITANEIKKHAQTLGTEKCGIAPVDRFNKAPEGFHPIDVFSKCKSVVVFLIQMPTEIIFVSNPIPYTNTAYLYWDNENKHGQGIISLRHAGYYAGIFLNQDHAYRLQVKRIIQGKEHTLDGNLDLLKLMRRNYV